jgi:hypothetical protein
MPTSAASISTSTQQTLDKLNQKYQELQQDFQKKHSEVYDWMLEHSLDYDDLQQLSKQLLVAVSMAGQIAITQPVEAQVNQQLAQMQKQKDDLLSKLSEEELEEVMQKMVSYVNGPVGHLSQDEELYLEQQLSDMLNFEVTAELDGHRLNHSIGIMGGEQHLRRYPSDSLDKHDAYLEAGMAPNRGAFGWFTEDGQLTQKAIDREKYYFAVQTLYLPDWNSNYQELKPWYKFRKMIVINPAERLAVVGVVGDAGPAMWVKKQFGGSPEVIREGKIWSPKSRGKVILLFVDDPEDKVPLGPINLDELKQQLANSQT